MSGGDDIPDDDMLAAEYALGLLAQEERAAFAARLAVEPALAARVRFWDERFVSLAAGVAETSPPDAVQKAIEHRLFGTADSQGAERGGFWNSIGFWRGLAAASLAGMIALGGYGYIRQQEMSQQAVLVSELSGEANAVRLVAVYDSGARVLKVNRTDLAIPADRDLELWLIAGTDAPRSVGVIPQAPGGEMAVSEELAQLLGAGIVLAVSEEPVGGSPTGQPTGAVLAAGPVLEL